MNFPHALFMSFRNVFDCNNTHGIYILRPCLHESGVTLVEGLA